MKLTKSELICLYLFLTIVIGTAFEIIGYILCGGFGLGTPYVLIITGAFIIHLLKKD